MFVLLAFLLIPYLATSLRTGNCRLPRCQAVMPLVRWCREKKC